MKELRKDADRDDVLFSFHRTCERPTAHDVIVWTERFPAFTDDIIAHAALMRQMSAQVEQPSEDIDHVLLARGRSHALNALHLARAENSVVETKSEQSFEAMMNAAGTDIPRLASSLKIKRTVLAQMIGGRMLPPVGERLAGALTESFKMTREQFDSALARALGAPKLGMAKADAGASITPRSYENIIRSSGMSNEECAYWLGED